MASGTSGTSSASDHARAPTDPDCGGASSPWAPTSGAIAVAAAAAAAAPGAADIAVIPSSTVPRTAASPPPSAADSSGWADVMTGARNRSESVVVMAGMRAPPPTDTTAASSRTPLRCNVSCRTSAKPASGPRSTSSSSVRVRRTSLRCPGSSATNDVNAAVDSRSLAPRHCARSRDSDPIAEVLDKSTAPAADRSSMTWVNSAWSTRSPDRSW
nr:hypothetical protein CPGR_02098 [Mycolicibacterium komanii]